MITFDLFSFHFFSYVLTPLRLFVNYTPCVLFVSYGLYYFLPGSSYGFTIVINFALLDSSSEIIDNVSFPLHEVALLDVHARIGR